MYSFATDTQPEKISENEFSASISSRWEIWGPNGGYLSAIALRAVGERCVGFYPVSYSCHYLNVAEFATVTIQVTELKAGKTSRAYEAIMLQKGKCILKAWVWVASHGDGLQHNFMPVPRSWVPLKEMPEHQPVWNYKFWDNFSIRTLQPDFDSTRKSNGGIAPNWFKFEPEIALDDPFLNAARSVLLIDTLQWPAAVMAHDAGMISHVAPSLDLTVHFHDSTCQSQWLFCEATTKYAGQGLIAGAAAVWDVNGTILASGGSQSMCKKIRA